MAASVLCSSRSQLVVPPALPVSKDELFERSERGAEGRRDEGMERKQRVGELCVNCEYIIEPLIKNPRLLFRLNSYLLYNYNENFY